MGPRHGGRVGDRDAQRDEPLQSRPAIQVAPVVFVIQTAVPVALAPILFNESFAATPGGGVPLGFSLALVVAGAAVLARSPLLLALMAGEPGGSQGDGADEPPGVATADGKPNEPAPLSASR